MLGQSQTLIMGFSQPAEASPAKAAKQEDRQTCLPVTVRAVEGALSQSASNDGEIRIHGAEHGMLVLVGIVESVTKQAASMELSLSDATGRIKVRHYIAQGQSKDLDEITVGRYISAFGNVRTSPEPHFVATGMRLVKSADEISYHMIECAHAMLKIQRGVVAEPSTPSPKKMPAAALQDTAQKVPASQSATPLSATQVEAKTQGALDSAALKSAILAYLQQQAAAHPEGCALEAVFSHVKSTPQDNVRKMMEKLVDDGEIFTTIDDEHFQCL